MGNTMNNGLILSSEQQMFVSKALEGHNILVDACIGSGKTTAIQRLCDAFPVHKKILYLTYNRLLKLDARAKIKNFNVTVTNYHGFAYTALKNAGKYAGISDLIQCFNAEKPPIERYDVLVIDEYQDIEQETATLLEIVKAANPAMQIIAVGDMEQKIYDKTTLDVGRFIEDFLGKHIKLEFTLCFRLNGAHAAFLGRVWKKEIIGVNNACRVETMGLEEAVAFLSSQRPRDILCLGSRTGKLSFVLNALEEEYPAVFNKNTVFASISERDAGASYPRSTSAIFTTYDSSKGLERKICMLFDFTESYWEARIVKPQQSYEILRNIFCVAASRGKERIIFVSDGEAPLSEETLSDETQTGADFSDVEMSSMFDFKYKEDVEACYNLLKITPLTAEKQPIPIPNTDGLIDLSPCIGIFQEADFFSNYDIDRDIELWLEVNRDRRFLFREEDRALPVAQKILLLVSLETRQNRYMTQARCPFVSPEAETLLHRRLETLFSRDETVQAPCRIEFGGAGGRRLFTARGYADVLKDGIVYELKFVSELAHEHFLQCASYVVALGLERGVLWNTRDNLRYEIGIPDRAAFLDAVARTVTKHFSEKYYPAGREA